MRVLVTGAGGMLASALAPALEAEGFEVSALPRADLDVTDPAAVADRVERLLPGAVVQCAAYTAVDAAEADEEAAFRVNAQATRIMADACQRTGSLLVYPSTDYVFAGDSSRPYRPDDPIAPLGAYGRSKAAGERAAAGAGRALIVRTSWLYGPDGRNFVDTIFGIARERDRLEVVDDQVGRPSWTGTLGRTIARLLKVGARGTFHATDGGAPVSWYGLAQKILELAGSSALLVPISTESLARAAPRPRYSVLDCSSTEALLGEALPDWESNLVRHLSRAGGS